MSGGYYPPIDPTKSHEFVGPRHRLPVIAPPRPLISSNLTASNVYGSQPSWMHKHTTAANYHENSGFYGHAAVARDYASISRAHCNDESSAWSNPHFSHPLGHPPFGGVFGPESAPPKGTIQRESMDLSPTQPAVPVALMSHSPAGALSRLVAVNGDPGADHDLKQRLYPSSPLVDPKPEAPANASTTPLPNRMPELPGFAALRTPGDAGRPPPTMPSAPDNVEFALESLFHSDTSLTVTPPAQNPRTLCVESVEKILKSPSPDSDDELTILYDSHSDKITLPGRNVDTKPEKPPVAKAADKTTKVLILKKKNCDCAPKTSNSTAKATKPPAKCERLNDVKPSETAKKTNCDGDRNEASKNPTENPTANDNLTLKTESSNVRSEEKPIEKNTRSKANANSTSKAESNEEKPIANTRSRADTTVKTEPTSGNESTEKITRSKAADLTVKTEPSNDEKSTDVSKAVGKESTNNEEITYVQVENELEKMFAGIEDSTVNGSDKDPLVAAKCDSNNLSIMSTQNSANLFDGVKAAKASKKKASKKSKPAGSKMKEKQKSSSSFKETSSSLEARRVPVIHIEGSKENPISAHIINSIKSEEDDVSDGRTSAKRKLGKSDRAVKKSTFNLAFKNYDPATSDATWVCVFCNLCAHAPGMAGEATGDLFGPYFIRTPEQINLAESKLHSWRSTHSEQVKKKPKRSLSIENEYMDMLTSDEQKSLEVWAHENCIVWASGVHLIGSKLIGLEEAVVQALETICAHCSNKGATIGCRARHCNSCAHYSCAIYTGWKLDTDTFISTCSVHSQRVQGAVPGVQ